jgi:hypothetical protein
MFIIRQKRILNESSNKILPPSPSDTGRIPLFSIRFESAIGTEGKEFHREEQPEFLHVTTVPEKMAERRIRRSIPGGLVLS